MNFQLQYILQKEEKSTASYYSLRVLIPPPSQSLQVLSEPLKTDATVLISQNIFYLTSSRESRSLGEGSRGHSFKHQNDIASSDHRKKTLRKYTQYREDLATNPYQYSEHQSTNHPHWNHSETTPHLWGPLQLQ